MLLYLAKRVRLNKFTAIAFLGTRAQIAAVQDWEMPRRGVRYIDCSNDVSICLEARRSEVVLECAAASFAECKDYESHTAGVISLLCKGLLYVKSAKQELMSKSSMEAELIGISDMLPRVVWTRKSLVEQGYKCRLARWFQVDHVSTAVLASKVSSRGQDI
jgi:hypothetical protein